MLSLTIACAPRPIEVKTGATDCAWAVPLWLGEDAIAALRQREQDLAAAGEHARAFRLRADRKAIADHNTLVEAICGASLREGKE